MKMRKALEDAGIKKKKREKPLTSPCGKDLKIYCIDTGYNMAIKELNTLSISMSRAEIEKIVIPMLKDFFWNVKLLEGDAFKEAHSVLGQVLSLQLANTDGIIKIGREE